MGWGKKLGKSLKKAAKKVTPTNINSGTKFLRSANSTRNELPTNVNEITDNARRVAQNSPRNINSMTEHLRDIERTDGKVAITGYKEGTASAHNKAVAEKQAREQAVAVAAQAEQQKAADEKKAALDAKISQGRRMDQGYLQSLRGMRQASMPQGVPGARFGDINRYGSNRAPMQNMGMTAPPSNFSTGMASQYRQPFQPGANVAIDPIRPMTGPVPYNPQGRPMFGRPMGMTQPQNTGVMPGRPMMSPQNTGVMGPQSQFSGYQPQGRPIVRR